MSLYSDTFPQLTKMLRNLQTMLTLAAENAEGRGFHGNVLMKSRLAPDQWPLIRQIQAACDTPKLAAGRLSGATPPKNDDKETTLDEIRGRIDSTIAFLESVPESSFEGCESKRIALPPLKGGTMTGADYVHQFVLPNFYFHLTTAYAILRNNGVALGKRPYLGSLTFEPPAE